MMSYYTTRSNQIVKRESFEDGSTQHKSIQTDDPANTDYQAFLKYQAEGGKVYGADEEVPTPADEDTQ